MPGAQDRVGGRPWHRRRAGRRTASGSDTGSRSTGANGVRRKPPTNFRGEEHASLVDCAFLGACCRPRASNCWNANGPATMNVRLNARRPDSFAFGAPRSTYTYTVTARWRSLVVTSDKYRTSQLIQLVHLGPMARDEMLQRAEHCRLAADAAGNSDAKLALLKAALTWRTLAAERQAIEAFEKMLSSRKPASLPALAEQNPAP